jgi:hypothetical protein
MVRKPLLVRACQHTEALFPHAGSGQVVDQGARLVDIALEDGSAFKLDGWKYISEAFPNNTLHFIGLLSDGGVHSRYDQLIGFIKGATKDGAKSIRVHILTVRARCYSCLKPSFQRSESQLSLSTASRKQAKMPRRGPSSSLCPSRLLI